MAAASPEAPPVQPPLPAWQGLLVGAGVLGAAVAIVVCLLRCDFDAIWLQRQRRRQHQRLRSAAEIHLYGTSPEQRETRSKPLSTGGKRGPRGGGGAKTTAKFANIEYANSEVCEGGEGSDHVASPGVLDEHIGTITV